MTTDTWVQASGLLAAVLVLAAGLLVITLHLVATGVDPRKDGVSAYARSRFGGLYRAQVIATGAAALVLTLTLMAGGLEAGGGGVVLALFGVSRILIARYPTDPRGTTRFSRAGRIHVLLAATTFVTIAIAAPWISRTLSVRADWRGPTTALLAVGWTTTLLVIGTFASSTLPATRRVFGLVERGAYAAWMLWILMVALSIGGWA